MAENSKVRIIDPMFDIPDEVGDFEYSADPLLGHGLEPEDGFLEEEFVDDSYYDDGDEEYFDTPETPDTFVVVAQNIRTLENGTQVVDLIVDVEDVAGVDKYDFRVAKVLEGGLI